MKKGDAKWVLIGLALIAIIALLIINRDKIRVFNPRATATPTPTVIGATALPTTTPSPLATPTNRFATSTPTPTPKATPTPKPVLSATSPSCAKPDAALSKKIDDNTARVRQMETEYQDLERRIDAYNPKGNTEYQNMVNDYNNRVNEHNKLVAETNTLLEQYKKQVSTYNSCIN